MNIGIIVCSQTGNTMSVAQKLKERLMEKGHSAEIRHIKTVDTYKPGQGEISVAEIFETKEYDGLVLASPVEGFSLCPIMKKYLSQSGSLDGKNCALLMTQYFPYPWMGGLSAMKQFREQCEAKGAKLAGTGIVNWPNKKREQKIAETVEALSELF